MPRRLPYEYITASNILKAVTVHKQSLNNVLYSQRSAKKRVNIQLIRQLVLAAINHKAELQAICNFYKEKFGSDENFSIDEEKLSILVAELFWVRRYLPHSEHYHVRLIEEHKDALEKIVSSIVTPEEVHYPRYVRVNLLKTTEENVIQCFENEGWVKLETASTYDAYLKQLKKLNGSNFIQDFHFSEMLAFPAKTNFHRHKLLEDNFIILHSKSSCIPVKLLNPRPGSIILDMCAAPGIKTSLLAAHINNNGEIHAVEKSMNRFETMNKLLHQFGATCVKTYNTDVLQMKLKDKIPGVTHILVDPSCSGSGMERPEMQEEKPEEQVRRLSTFQFRALVKALWYPSVRRVVYSTCSLNPLENEAVVRDAINFTGHTFKVVDAWPATKDQFRRGSAEYPGGELCLYVIPEKDLCTGFFVAVLERNSKKNRKRKDGNQESENSYPSVDTSMFTDKYGESILHQLEDDILHTEYKKNKKQKIWPEVEQEKMLDIKTESCGNERKHKKIFTSSQNDASEEIDFENRESSKKYKKKKSYVDEPEEVENMTHVDGMKQKRKKTGESSKDKSMTELDDSQKEGKPHKKSKKNKKQKVDDDQERVLETAADSNSNEREKNSRDAGISSIDSEEAVPHTKSKKGKHSKAMHGSDQEQELDTCSKERKKKTKKKVKEAEDVPHMDSALMLEPQDDDVLDKKSRKRKQKVEASDGQEVELETEVKRKRKSQDLSSMEFDLEVVAPSEAELPSKKSKKKKQKSNDEGDLEIVADSCSSEQQEHKSKKKTKKAQDLPSMEFDCESETSARKNKKQRIASNKEQEGEVEIATDSCGSNEQEHKNKKKTKKAQDLPSMEFDCESETSRKNKKQRIASNKEQEGEVEIATDSCGSNEQEHKNKKKTKKSQDLPSMEFDCESETSRKNKKQKIACKKEK